jgi:hypothetical protein
MRAPRISVNGLYEYGTGTPLVRTERLLWIDSAKIVAILIEVRGPHSREHSVPYGTFFDDVEHFTARPVEELPEFSYLMQPDSAFSAAQIRERDERYAAMEIFLKKPPQEQFDPHERAKTFAEIASRKTAFTDEEVAELTNPILIRLLTPHIEANHRMEDKRFRNPLHLNEATLYVLYRRMLQGGGLKRINTLISLRHKAGWNLENRLTHASTNKLGRSWIADTEEERRAGRFVTPSMRPILVNIGILFHERPVGGVKLNWPEAVRRGQQAFFSNGWKPDGDVLIPDMPESGQMYSEWQIRHEYYKARKLGLFLPDREGERTFNLKLRAMTDDQRALASRPLQLVQSDCWDCPIYLVHPITRLVIGRPLLIMMRDTMSRMIVAYALSWNHEGGIVTLLAVENLVTNKVAHCKTLNIDIEPEWWPCQDFICEGLLSDNGAWITKRANHVCKGLGMDVWNTGTARGDHKPVIETIWDDLYDRKIKMLPGALPLHPLSGDLDPVAKRAWERAALDIHQFQVIIVRYILHHNCCRYFKDYPLTDAMKGKVRPIPLELWNHGIDEDGLPNPTTLDRVRINCLEHVEATVTGDGIKLREKLLYACETAKREGWFSRARAGHTWKIPALFDRRNVAQIFRLRDQKNLRPGDRELEDCTRIKARREETNIHLEEFESEQFRQKAEHNRYMREMPSHDAQFDGHCDHIVAEGVRMTTEALNGSKQAKCDLRARHKDAKDEENGLLPADPPADDPSLQPSTAQLDPDGSIAAASDSELDLYR